MSRFLTNTSRMLSLYLSVILLVGVVFIFTFTSSSIFAQTAATVGPVVAVTDAVDPTLVSLGTLGASVLNWTLAVIAPIVSFMVVGLLSRLMTRFGIQVQGQHREKLQEIVVNGINWASQNAAVKMQGKLTVQVQGALQQQVLNYVRTQGMDTIKNLNMDPNSPEFIQAVQARIQRALNDPLAPTPPEWTPSEVLGMMKTRDDPRSQGTTGAETRG